MFTVYVYVSFHNNFLIVVLSSFKSLWLHSLNYYIDHEILRFPSEIKFCISCSQWNKNVYLTVTLQYQHRRNLKYHLACDNGKTSPLLKPFIPAYNVKNLCNNNYTCISNIKNKLLVTELWWQFTHALMPEILVGFSFGESRSTILEITSLVFWRVPR